MFPFFTIGHSTRPVEEFIALLRANEVTRLADVRSFPRSRTNPQYNADALPGLLAPHGIGHEHIAALGGMKKRDAAIAPEANGFWENGGFHAYADYAMASPVFAAGLARLLDLGRRERVAIMCAEAVWWRCHRRLIADDLVARGWQVLHLMAKGRVEPHPLNADARLVDGVLRYPATEAGQATLF